MLHSGFSLVDAAVADIEADRFESAIVRLAPLTAVAMPSHPALSAHAEALKGLGRTEEALVFSRRATELYPTSAVAWHNLAATLGDLGYAGEAKQAVERAFTFGLERPETLMIYARATNLLGDFPVAERAFRMALSREPDNTAAACELAHLLWIVTKNVETATAPLAEALTLGADEETIADTLVKIFEIAERRGELRALCARLVSRSPDNPRYLVLAARTCLVDGEIDRALDLIDRSLALDSTAVSAVIHSVAVRLAADRPGEALAAARRAVELDPRNQATWGWLATAARANGQPEYATLFDYDSFVKSYTIDTPAGWANLDAFLADLGRVLKSLHRVRAEPLSQSVRGGTQTIGDLYRSDHPTLRAFFSAIDRPIREYLKAVGGGSHPFLSRNTGHYKIQAAWSVLLRSQGRHSNHFHPMGWLSSAFYIAVPPSEPGAREGWIQFGEPPYPTASPQPAERFIEPKPGTLVLFPSYMWHGTVPFTASAERLTIAFDAIPT